MAGQPVGPLPFPVRPGPAALDLPLTGSALESSILKNPAKRFNCLWHMAGSGWAFQHRNVCTALNSSAFQEKTPSHFHLGRSQQRCQAEFLTGSLELQQIMIRWEQGFFPTSGVQVKITAHWGIRHQHSTLCPWAEAGLMSCFLGRLLPCGRRWCLESCGMLGQRSGAQMAFTDMRNPKRNDRRKRKSSPTAPPRLTQTLPHEWTGNNRIVAV